MAQPLYLDTMWDMLPKQKKGFSSCSNYFLHTFQHVIVMVCRGVATLTKCYGSRLVTVVTAQTASLTLPDLTVRDVRMLTIDTRYRIDVRPAIVILLVSCSDLPMFREKSGKAFFST